MRQTPSPSEIALSCRCSDEMPAGQTPVTVTVVAHNDLVDAVQPGDRWAETECSRRVHPRLHRSGPACNVSFVFSVQVTGIFRAVPVRINPRNRNVRSVYRTFIDVIHFRRQKSFTVDGALEEEATNDDEESLWVPKNTSCQHSLFC